MLDDALQVPHIDAKARPPQAFPFCFRSPKTGLHALYDQAPLQLRDGGDDREDRLAEGRTRINLFAERDEFHAQVMEQVERLHEMPNRTPEAVEGRDHDHIHMPALDLGHELVEGGPALLGSRDAGVGGSDEKYAGR